MSHKRRPVSRRDFLCNAGSGLGAIALSAMMSADGLVSRASGAEVVDPLAPKQYYLAQDHAFDAFASSLPLLAPVKVAIIDSGIDGSHPDLKGNGKVYAAHSFVGGSALTDEEGHGTFVAGEVAASINNEQGIAGIAFPAQLIVAKIARADASISVRDSFGIAVRISSADPLQFPQPNASRAVLLESRPGLQRHLRARPEHLLDTAARDHETAAGLRRPRLFRLRPG